MLTLNPLSLRSWHVAMMQTCVSMPHRTAVSMPRVARSSSSLASTSGTSIVKRVLLTGGDLK